MFVTLAAPRRLPYRPAASPWCLTVLGLIAEVSELLLRELVQQA